MPKIIIAVLLQSGLYYHKSLNNKLTKYFDHIHVKSLFKQAEIIFANSNSTKNEVLSLGIPATKIAMISCGHDPLPTVKRKQKTKKSIQLLYVGRVSRNRGLDYLMHALGKLTDYNWQLLVVGDEKDNPEFVGSLSTLAIQYNIANRVEFYGFTKDRHELAALYNQADIFVLPSLVEGFGIVLLEAMSAGLAIVATTAGAIPELIKNNKTGLLVPPGDIDHLTNTIEKAMKDETLRKNIGQNAKYIYEQEFRTKYTWEIVIANINNVLTSP